MDLIGERIRHVIDEPCGSGGLPTPLSGNGDDPLIPRFCSDANIASIANRTRCPRQQTPPSPPVTTPPKTADNYFIVHLIYQLNYYFYLFILLFI